MASPAVAYSTAQFPSFYDAMVASLPAEFEVAEARKFYTNLALSCSYADSAPAAAVKILDLCTGTGSIPRCIAAAWAGDGDGGSRKCRSLQMIGVDNSEEMLNAARRAWIEVPGGDVEWRLATLGREGALAGIGGVDLALVSAGSFHHLATRKEQVVAMAEVKESLKLGGLLVLNVFALAEIVEEVSGCSGLDTWHLNDGFWKQTLEKEVETVEDGGITGTETFKVGCVRWSEEMVCSWTLRAVRWEEVRELCKEVAGLMIVHEFSTFHDALNGRSADMEETGEAGRIFVIQRWT